MLNNLFPDILLKQIIKKYENKNETDLLNVLNLSTMDFLDLEPEFDSLINNIPTLNNSSKKLFEIISQTIKIIICYHAYLQNKSSKLEVFLSENSPQDSFIYSLFFHNTENLTQEKFNNIKDKYLFLHNVIFEENIEKINHFLKFLTPEDITIFCYKDYSSHHNVNLNYNILSKEKQLLKKANLNRVFYKYNNINFYINIELQLINENVINKEYEYLSNKLFFSNIEPNFFKQFKRSRVYIRKIKEIIFQEQILNVYKNMKKDYSNNEMKVIQESDFFYNFLCSKNRLALSSFKLKNSFFNIFTDTQKFKNNYYFTLLMSYIDYQQYNLPLLKNILNQLDISLLNDNDKHYIIKKSLYFNDKKLLTLLNDFIPFKEHIKENNLNLFIKSFDNFSVFSYFNSYEFLLEKNILSTSKNDKSLFSYLNDQKQNLSFILFLLNEDNKDYIFKHKDYYLNEITKELLSEKKRWNYFSKNIVKKLFSMKIKICPNYGLTF